VDMFASLTTLPLGRSVEWDGTSANADTDPTA